MSFYFLSDNLFFAWSLNEQKSSIKLSKTLVKCFCYPREFICLYFSDILSSSTLSGLHMKNTERPESAPPSGQPFAISQPSLNTPGEHLVPSGGHTIPVRRRGGEERCSSSSLSRSISPLHWPNRTWPSSLTSQSDHGSDHGECHHLE